MDEYLLDCVAQRRPEILPAADVDEAIKTMAQAEAILAGTRQAGGNRPGPTA